MNSSSIFFCLLLFFPGLFSVSNKEDPGPDSGCRQVLESFAHVTANFTYCTLRNARPITVCRSCIDSFLKARSVYVDITHLSDIGGQNCRDILSNLDRLQVVEMGMSYINHLWAKAFCDTCFLLDEEGLPTPKFTPVVQDIWGASSKLNVCIEANRNSSQPSVWDPAVCSECLSDYDYLNSIYNNLKVSTGTINFCMDIVDLMNRTRESWSNELGCCQDRKRSEVVFMAVSSVIAMLPFMFYGAAYTFTKKKEQTLSRQKRWTEKLYAQEESYQNRDR